MAATVSLLGSATFNTTSGTKTVTATPAVGDLIVIVTAHSGNTSTAAPTDNNSSGTYTLVNTAVKATSADTMKMWVRNSLITSATSTVFTHAPGTSTGGGLAVLKITGMDKTGATAVVSSGKQDNQAAGGTPAPALGATPSATNPIITAVFNATSPANVTARTNYTRTVNLGYSTPTTGLAVADDDAGETSATITWGGTSGSAFASIAAELDSRVTHAATGALTGQLGSVAGSAQHNVPHSTSGTLTGSGSEIVGAADHESASVPHETTGALVGPGATVDGAATRFRAFGTSGALTGQGSAIVGDADHEAAVVPHVATGALIGAGAVVNGTAQHNTVRPSSGALIGAGAVVAGSAAHLTLHSTSGVLIGQGSVIVGEAVLTPYAPPVHDGEGSLDGGTAIIVGSASRSSLYPDPSDVRAGVKYGPGGIYVGTLTVGAGETIIRLRSFTERF